MYFTFFMSYIVMFSRSLILNTLPIVYQKTSLGLQPEDGYIKKPKHVANMIFYHLIIVYITRVC